MLQSVESKKEEFQKYLEKSGVIDSLTKGTNVSFLSSCMISHRFYNVCLTYVAFSVLVGLYEAPDRPANAIEYVN